jgi:hypothetical protein
MNGVLNGQLNDSVESPASRGGRTSHGWAVSVRHAAIFSFIYTVHLYFPGCWTNSQFPYPDSALFSSAFLVFPTIYFHRYTVLI